MDTAIEKIEPYSMFRDTFFGLLMIRFSSCCQLTLRIVLQQNQPQLYESLTKNLSPEEQSIIQNVIVQANIIQVEERNLAATRDSQQVNGQSAVSPLPSNTGAHQ